MSGSTRIGQQQSPQQQRDLGADSINPTKTSTLSESPSTKYSSPSRQHSRSSSQLATLASGVSLNGPPSSGVGFGSSPTKWGQFGSRSPRMSLPPINGAYKAVGNPFASPNGDEASPERRRNSELSRKFTLQTPDGNSSESEDDLSSTSIENITASITSLAEEAARPRMGRSATLPTSEFSAAKEALPFVESPIPSPGPNLAQLIQQKRRQASAPYFGSARSSSLYTAGGAFSVSNPKSAGQGNTSPARSSYAGAWGLAQDPGVKNDAARRQRSRQASWVGMGGPTLGPLGPAFDPLGSGETGMVMTPTTEEWRQLGGQLSELADLRSRDEARISLSDTGSRKETPEPTTSGADSLSSSSSSSSLNEMDVTFQISQTSLSRHSSQTTSTFSERPTDPPTPPTGSYRSSFSYQTSRSGFMHSPAYSASSTPSTDPLPSTSTFSPTHRPQQSESSLRPNLTRGSLSSHSHSHSKTPSIGTPIYAPEMPVLPEAVPTPQEISRPSSPVELDWSQSLGPVDPRKYSAVTGLRSISDFVIEGEAGRGAYGTVSKARLKGPDQEPTGPELIIKYIIKQRILADCWKKHKILGPIPIEVHVLDHLRRVPYLARPTGRRLRSVRPLGSGQRRDSAPSLKEGTITGHPNICGMLDFFEDGEFYYLVMPQAGADPDSPGMSGGQDLFDYVELHPDGLDPLSIRHIFSQIADSLYFLHEHGIVHRDIKDENIVLDYKGNVQVIDFGSAAYVKDGKKFDTVSGTLDWAAPEVLRGARYGGKETDIWALGVLGYVLICGECPFWSPDEAMRGLAPDSRAGRALRAKCVSTSNSSFTSSTSSAASSWSSGVVAQDAGKIDDAVDLVMRCLEIDPTARPSADQVLNHQFILGRDGWRGIRGWMDDVSP